MYKITVNTSSKSGNVSLGARYCLTRKSAIKLANLFLDSGCNITIAKFIHCCSDIFFWSDKREETKIIIDEENLTARKATKDDFQN